MHVGIKVTALQGFTNTSSCQVVEDRDSGGTHSAITVGLYSITYLRLIVPHGVTVLALTKMLFSDHEDPTTMSSV